jgi:hypothetical protein
VRTFHFDIFADYHQVYLDDCQLRDELTRVEGRDPHRRSEEIAAHVAVVLSPEAFARQLGVARGTLCILTARYVDVPVTVQIQASAPTDDFAPWDRVVEASLEVPSGCIAVHGPTDFFLDVPRITVAPGSYRARVYYGGLATVSADELEGADHYRIELWPEPAARAAPMPSVLHTRASSRC